ncbi:MAG: response regulator [Nostocaceae cyanobacterium]|nr:response regulator [Nostocaceae cyanobacterium]
MQGNLQEIDICSILQLIELGQRTGVLLVEAYSYGVPQRLGICSQGNYRHKSWYIFFDNGYITYASDGDSSLSRLSDYLRRYRIQVNQEEIQLKDLASLNVPEYSYLWSLLEENLLNPTQAGHIIHCLVYETLFDLLILTQGQFIFTLDSPLEPQLTHLNVTAIISKVTRQVQQWKQLYSYIQSPEQCPVLADIAQLKVALPAVTMNKLQQSADGKTSLRQLARYLNSDILTVAQAIYPYVEEGLVKIASSSVDKVCNFSEKSNLGKKPRGRIVCIDNHISIGETVKSILAPQGYEAIALNNPLEALSLVFELQPDLILCDIAMTKLNGYDICAMLRNSTDFRQVPIVVLSAEEIFMDRLRAKILGANDYLIKPFGHNELVMVVEKYLCSKL